MPEIVALSFPGRPTGRDGHPADAVGSAARTGPIWRAPQTLGVARTRPAADDGWPSRQRLYTWQAHAVTMDESRDQGRRPMLEGDGPMMESQHDALGNFLSASDEAKEVTGRGPDGLVGESSADMVHPDDAAIVADAYEAAWGKGEPVVLVVRGMDTDGGSHWMRSRFVLSERDPPRFTAWTQRTERPEKGKAWFRVGPEEE